MSARERLQNYVGNGEKAKGTFSDAEMRRRLDDIRKYMAANKIDAALFQFRATTVDVRRVTTGIVRDLRHLYPNRITLSARGASPRIMGDPDLIRQALTNLITNAEIGRAHV